jgi:hypothetical protein
MLTLPATLRLTAAQFAEVCAANPEAVLELDADGHLVEMTPAGGEASARNQTLGALLWLAVRQSGLPLKVFDSSTGFLLPDGSIRSPDASLVRLDRWQALSEAERRGFPPLCPDLVVELASPSNHARRAAAQDGAVCRQWRQPGLVAAPRVPPRGDLDRSVTTASLRSPPPGCQSAVSRPGAGSRRDLGGLSSGSCPLSGRDPRTLSSWGQESAKYPLGTPSARSSNSHVARQRGVSITRSAGQRGSQSRAAGSGRLLSCWCAAELARDVGISGSTAGIWLSLLERGGAGQRLGACGAGGAELNTASIRMKVRNLSDVTGLNSVHS